MKLIDEWRQGWKFYSVWLWACVGALPNLYDLLVASGWVDQLKAEAPGGLVWAIRATAVAGIVVRFIQQHRPPSTDDIDQAGA